MLGIFTGWQDMVLTGGGFVLAVGLLPMLRAPAHLKPPLSSSLTIWAVLTAYAVAMATLGLVASAIGVGIQAFVWGVIACQHIRWNHQW